MSFISNKEKSMEFVTTDADNQGGGWVESEAVELDDNPMEEMSTNNSQITNLNLEQNYHTSFIQNHRNIFQRTVILKTTYLHLAFKEEHKTAELKSIPFNNKMSDASTLNKDEPMDIGPVDVNNKIPFTSIEETEDEKINLDESPLQRIIPSTYYPRILSSTRSENHDNLIAQNYGILCQLTTAVNTTYIHVAPIQKHYVSCEINHHSSKSIYFNNKMSSASSSDNGDPMDVVSEGEPMAIVSAEKPMDMVSVEEPMDMASVQEPMDIVSEGEPMDIVSAEADNERSFSRAERTENYSFQVDGNLSQEMLLPSYYPQIVNSCVSGNNYRHEQLVQNFGILVQNTSALNTTYSQVAPMQASCEMNREYSVSETDRFYIQNVHSDNNMMTHRNQIQNAEGLIFERCKDFVPRSSASSPGNKNARKRTFNLLNESQNLDNPKYYQPHIKKKKNFDAEYA